MINRVYVQYRSGPKAVAWYDIIPSLAGQLEDVLQDVRSSYDIETANDYDLDVIGRIVSLGVTRASVTNADTYRALLRSKIAKNNSDATIDGIVTAMQFIIPSSTALVSDFENMSMDVAFGGALSPETIDILDTYDLVPKPQGVRFRGFAIIPMSTIYGADDAQYGADDAQYGFYFGGDD